MIARSSLSLGSEPRWKIFSNRFHEFGLKLSNAIFLPRGLSELRPCDAKSSNTLKTILNAPCFAPGKANCSEGSVVSMFTFVLVLGGEQSPCGLRLLRDKNKWKPKRSQAHLPAWTIQGQLASNRGYSLSIA